MSAQLLTLTTVTAGANVFMRITQQLTVKQEHVLIMQ